MSDSKDGTTYLGEELSEPELLAIRGRWTARGARGAMGADECAQQLAEAQRDLGRLLRHLDAFNGPPVIGA